MAIAKRLKRAFLTLLAALGLVLWFAALLLFSRVTENSDDFGRLQNWIVSINVIGIAVLLVLIVVNLAQLIRDYRRHVPGARLRARMVTLLVMVAVTPLLGVYVYSLVFINRGIDNWLSIDLRQTMVEALDLSKAAIDTQTHDKRGEVERMAERLGRLGNDELLSVLGDLQRGTGASQLTVFGQGNEILATTSGRLEDDVPPFPGDELRLQLRQGDGPYVRMDTLPGDRYQVVVAASLVDALGRRRPEFLQAVFPTDQRFSALAESVRARQKEYTELTFMSDGLKYGFTLALSLVLLISLLASVYGAFYFARRLVVPIQQLMQGTRAVARGDFATRVPTPARDEIGFLVSSFNEMTQRLEKASEAARSSQEQVERERRKLEVILARLSTGVVSLEPDLRIRTANPAAGAILGVDLETHVGESLFDLALTRPLLAQFVAVSASHLHSGESEWREQIALRGEGGRRVLMCACTELSGESDNPNGYVIVFDDITTLLQAQRDAAWGEVARRLAHEIKNPLTPIQLSAERLRRKYLKTDSGEIDLLDRATHTIIQQVEAMKQMVNAFSEYARTPTMEITRFDVNALIAEVSDLYAHQEKSVSIRLALAAGLPEIEADAGRLRQVLHNLVRNALEAMEHQTEAYVEISTRLVRGPDADAIEIKVIDNGPGFVRDIVHQAFEPYVTSKPKGTGLGLAIVKKLIEEHGGQITARNREQGGAEISILIPTSVEAGNNSLGRRHDHRRERA